MRFVSSLFLVLATAGCDLDFQAQKDLPAGLARRIAQKRAEAEQRPSDPQAALQLGELYMEGERWFEAAEALSRARTNAPQDTRALGGLATAYMSLGFYNQVELLLRDCFQRNRQEPGCLYAAGELMMLVGSKPALEAARSVWSNLIAIAPNHQKAAYVRSALDQLNAQLGPPGAASQPSSRPAQPGQAANQELPAGHPPPAGHPTPSGHPAPSDPPAGAGNVDPTVPGHADAAGNQDVGELNPFGVAIQKAMTAVRNNDAAGAEEGYTEALKIRPKDPGALAGLAEAQLAQNRTADAVTSISRAWEADNKDPQVRLVFGRVMFQARQRTDEAIAAWESIIRDTPDYARQLGLDRKLAEMKQFIAPPK